MATKPKPTKKKAEPARKVVEPAKPSSRNPIYGDFLAIIDEKDGIVEIASKFHVPDDVTCYELGQAAILVAAGLADMLKRSDPKCTIFRIQTGFGVVTFIPGDKSA